MDLEWEYQKKGHILQIMPSLRRALGQYKRYYGEYKIGLTTDPGTRLRDYKKDGWTKMRILYETSSINYVAKAECLLIEYAWDTDVYGQCVNKRGGGGGRRKGHERYYLYVALLKE